jgi:formimidoylglutamate deiminase
MKEYVGLGGRWSIGTDSHIGIDPLEEFRMIDYRQRLITNARNTFGGDAAHYMINEEIVSGRKAMGIISKDNFEVGKPFDAVIFDGQAPLLNAISAKHLAAAIIYSSDASSKLGTIINGRWIVKFNKHITGSSIRSTFQSAIQQIGIR